MLRQNNTSFRSWLFAILFTLSLLSSIFASPLLIARQQNQDGTVAVPDSAAGSNYQLTAHGIILAIILFICGLFFLFFGFRHFRLTMFLVGFYVFATVTWIILANAEPQNSYGTHRLTIYLLVSLGIGIFAGLFLACCFHLGLWLLGAFGGFVIGLWILAWRSGGAIQPRWGQGLLLGLAAFAGFVASICFETATVIIFTSFIGAYSIIFGLDIFLHTGFIQSAESFLDAKHNVVYQVNSSVYAMLGGLMGLALVGMAVQFFQSRRVVRQPWTKQYGRMGRYNRRPAAAAVRPDSETGKRRWWWFS